MNRSLLSLVFISSLALANIPSPKEVAKCLKNSVSKIDLNAMKEASRNLTRDIESSYKNISADYVRRARELATEIGKLQSLSSKEFEDAWNKTLGSYKSYKDSLTILKGSEAMKAALENRLEEINSLTIARINNIEQSVDPKRIAKSVQGTLKAQYEGLSAKATALQGKFDAMETTIAKLEDFNGNISPEDRAKAQADLKAQAQSIEEGAQGVLEQASQMGVALAKSKSLSDSLANVSSTAEAQTIIDQADVSPETKAAHQESLNKVKNGQQTLAQFKQDSSRNSQELSAEIAKNNGSISEAQAVLTKAEDFKSRLGNGLGSGLESAKAATDFLMSVKSEQAKLGSYIESGAGLISKYQEVSQAANPVTVLNTWQSELLSEKNLIINDINLINGALGQLQANHNQAKAILDSGLPGFLVQYQKYLDIENQLAPARAALDEAMNILEFGGGSQAVLLATQVAFQQLHPTIGCVSPWMKYVVMASLVTRGKLNFFDIFKGIAAKSNTPKCKEGVYMKSRGCYVPRNPEIRRAVERSKRLSKRIISNASGELNLRKRVAELIQLRNQVRVIIRRFYP